MKDLLFRPEPIVWVQELFGPGHPGIFRALTQFGTTWGIVLAIAVALWVWGRRDAYALVGIVVLEAVIGFGMNQLFGVSRPDAPAIIKYEHVQVGSFPSGHVLLATVLWGLLYARRRIPVVMAGIVVGVVALARLYLGVHYLADVIGGAVAGILLVWAYQRLWGWAEPLFERWPESGWVGITLLAVAGAVVAWLFGFFGENPFKWHAGGLVAGGAVALLLERRYVRYIPPDRDAGVRALNVTVGLVILLALAWVDRAQGESPYALGATLIVIGAVWAWFVAPALFARLDRARTDLRTRRDRGRHTVATLAATAGAIIVGLAVYGTAVEPRLYFDVEEQRAPIPELPPAWEGQEIAALGDFQVGMWWDNPGIAGRMVREAVERRPAAVLLLGDFIYGVAGLPAPEFDKLREILAPLASSGIRTFAVLGNHDWGLERNGARPDREAAQALRRLLEELGIVVLHNSSAAIERPDGGALYITGIGSHYLGEDRPGEALAAVPPSAPRVVFMHHPDSYPAIPAGAAPLAVAGHTHGGQIALPFLPDWSWLTFAKEDEVHADHWAEDAYGAAGNRLYVNRGTGMSVIPVRIGAPPELTLFTLVSADA